MTKMQIITIDKNKEDIMEYKRKRSRTTTWIAIILLILAAVVVIRGIFAFFSDFTTAQITATGGTLDIVKEGTASLTRYYKVGTSEFEDTGDTIANLNPGDIIVANYSVGNEGNKSAYLRNIATLTVGTNHAGVQVTPVEFELYPVTVSNDDIRNQTPTAVNAKISTTNITNGFQATTTPVVINGKAGSTGREIETVATTGVDGVDGPITAGYKLYFKPSAGNEYQGVSVTYNIRTEAIQFRNNATPVWENVADQEFTLGV